MKTNAVVPRLLIAAVVAAVVGTVGGFTFASARDTNTKAVTVAGYEIVQQHSPSTQAADVTIFCPRGKKALSGGGQLSGPTPSLAATLGRITASVPATSTATGPTRRKFSGWRTAMVGGFSGQESPMVEADFYVVCANA